MNTKNVLFKNKQCGLSMIEILITVFMISVIALMAVPDLTNLYEKRKVDEALYGLSEAVYIAKNTALRNDKAISGNIRSYIVFDDIGGCVLNAQNGAYVAQRTCSYSGAEKTALFVWRFKFNTDVKINGSLNKYCIAFDKYGMMDDNSLDGENCFTSLNYEIGKSEVMKSGRLL